MQLVYFVETFGEEDCVGTAMVALIKTVNKAISRLHNTQYPMNLSPEDELAIKNLEICWVCKRKINEGDAKSRDHDHLWQEYSSRGSNFQGLAHKLCNVNVRQQYFLPVYMHNSKYDLKSILPALARL
jgi:hypothetical protein